MSRKPLPPTEQSAKFPGAGSWREPLQPPSRRFHSAESEWGAGPALDADAAIRQTDCDAAGSRLSAVQLNYLVDPYAQHFVPRAHLNPQRPPLINIGTYLRTSVIDNLVGGFFEKAAVAGAKVQILSFGAGSDSRFWRIATGPLQDKLVNYIEIDFPEVTTKKAMTIKKSKVLSAVLGDPTLAHGGTALHSSRYHLLPIDIRVSPSEGLGTLLTSPIPNGQLILLPNVPTLLLFECVLVYMSPQESNAILRWVLEHFNASASGKSAVVGGIVYEMFKLNDAFGRIMLNNLKVRNVTLPGAEPYATFESLPTRFLGNGFSSARALTLHDIQKEYTPAEELERISQLEMLDEVEELNLVLDHYAVTWGLYVSDSLVNGVWGDWGLKRQRGD